MKEQHKVETRYSVNLKMGGDFETIEIIQEANEREAIRVSFFGERWRTPEKTVELLEKVIAVLKRDFIPPSNA